MTGLQDADARTKAVTCPGGPIVSAVQSHKEREGAWAWRKKKLTKARSVREEGGAQ